MYDLVKGKRILIQNSPKSTHGRSWYKQHNPIISDIYPNNTNLSHLTSTLQTSPASNASAHRRAEMTIIRGQNSPSRSAYLKSAIFLGYFCVKTNRRRILSTCKTPQCALMISEPGVKVDMHFGEGHLSESPRGWPTFLALHCGQNHELARHLQYVLRGQAGVLGQACTAGIG